MIDSPMSQYIRSVEIVKPKSKQKDSYPFTLDSVRGFNSLELHPNVTFLVGENGCGKSTLLEAIAVAYGFNAEGGSKNFNFATKETHSILYEYIKLIKGVKKAYDSFFLRAESFYNASTYIDELDDPALPPLHESYGGESLHNQSHGESFMSLVANRFRGKGLYILDEPEAALSPNKQLALVSLIHDLVKKDSQFIIATHSPIIMSYPNAVIYQVDNNCQKTDYMDTEHFQITKDFLSDPKRMLNILLED